MFCGQCGEFIPETNHFCTKCGAPVAPKFKGEDKVDFFLVTATVDEVNYTNHQELVSLVRRLKSDRVVIDLTRIKFVDSVGIGSLVTTAYSGARRGQNIKLLIKSKQVMKSIKTLGVDNILECNETLAEAVAGWGITL